MTEDFADFLAALNSEGVAYVVIGGIAVLAHIPYRTTRDRDVLIEATPDNARRAHQAVSTWGDLEVEFSPEEFIQGDILSFGGLLRVEIHSRVPGATWEKVWRDRVVGEFRGVDRDLCAKSVQPSSRPIRRAVYSLECGLLMSRPCGGGGLDRARSWSGPLSAPGAGAGDRMTRGGIDMRSTATSGIRGSILALVAVAVQACAGAGGPLPAPVDEAAPAGLTERDVAGVWTGKYVCGQGETGLRLSLRGTTEGRVDGTFEFFPVPSNPEVLEGSFQVEGWYSGTELVLNGREWVQQPPGYETVGLSGTVSLNPTTFNGTVLHPTCSTFTLRRD